MTVSPSPKAAEILSKRCNLPAMQSLGISLLLALAIFSTYLPALQAGFIWDDDDYITQNMTLRSFDGLRRIWLEPGATPQYYPLVHTTYWLEYRMWGLWAPGYHATNIVVHILGTLALAQCLLRLGVPGAWAIAAIFALHPMQVESVAWVTERKNTLSGLFMFLSLLLAIRAFRLGTEEPPQADDRPWVGWAYPASLLMYVAALFSKTVVCALAPVLVILIWWRRGRLAPREILATLPFFGLGAALVAVTVYVERHHVGTTQIDLDVDFMYRFMIAGQAIIFYLSKFIVPTNLAFIYPRWEVNDWTALMLLPFLGIMALLLVSYLLQRRIGRAPFALLSIYLVLLFPALGFIDVYPFLFSWVADHFHYHALVMPAIVLVVAITQLQRRAAPLWQPAMAASLAVLLLFMGGLSFRQAMVYRDIETLWLDTLAKNPRSWMVLNNLGLEMQRQNRLEEAAAWYSEALSVRSDATAYYNLGTVLHMLERHEEAAVNLRRALEIDASHIDAHANLGAVYMALDRPREAITHLGRAIESAPENARLHQALGRAHMARNQYLAAASAFQQAIERDASLDDVYFDLGLALQQQLRLDDAIVAYREAVRIDPYDMRPRHNLANALARSGQRDAALREYRAIARMDPNDPDTFYNMGQNLMAMGRYRDAAMAFETVLTIAPDDAAAHVRLQEAQSRLESPPSEAP